jgi:hypothetical protein
MIILLLLSKKPPLCQLTSLYSSRAGEVIVYIVYTYLTAQSTEQRTRIERGSVAEPHHFYAAPALGKNFDAAPAPAALALAPTLLYSKTKFLK